MDQSLPNVLAQRGRKRCLLNTFPILDISIRSGDICAQSKKKFEIGPKFACFSPPKFFLGHAFKFLDRRYKIDHASEHVAKFCGDRLRDPGDFVLKKKNCSKELFVFSGKNGV